MALIYKHQNANASKIIEKKREELLKQQMAEEARNQKSNSSSSRIIKQPLILTKEEIEFAKLPKEEQQKILNAKKATESYNKNKSSISKDSRSEKQKDADKKRLDYIENPTVKDYINQAGYMPLLALSDPFSMGEKLKEIRTINSDPTKSGLNKFNDVVVDIGLPAAAMAATTDLAGGLLAAPLGRGFSAAANKVNQYVKNPFPKIRNFQLLPANVTNSRLINPGLVNKVIRKQPFISKQVIGNEAVDLVNPIKNIKPTENFKSEIDWSKWNPETPKYPELINEYNAIEQSTKKAGTWMKNPDGSTFQGSPEQFIQQQSSWFKKAFPEGHNRVYRGGDNENLANRSHPIVFTANKATGEHYAGGLPFSKIIASPQSQKEYGRALFDLYHPKSSNSITIDNAGKSWREVPRKYFGENPPLRDLHNTKGDFTSTDDIAKWMVANDKNSVRLNNIFDSYDADFVDIVNHKPGNYLKSAVGNVGFFDMTNPNIYKALIPAIAGTAAIKEKRKGGLLYK